MKKYLEIFPLLFFVLISCDLLAQKGGDVSVDPKAKSILDQASSHFSSRNGLVCQINVFVENEQNDKKQNIPGVLSLKGDKFNLDLAGVTTFFDGKTEYVYLQKEKEVNISEPTAEDLKNTNPLLLLKSYKKGYKMKYVGPSKYKNQAVDVINLYPDDLSKQFSIITISISKSTQMPAVVRAQGKNGVNTTVSVESYKFQTLDDSLFFFDTTKHGDVDVIDLR